MEGPGLLSLLLVLQIFARKTSGVSFSCGDTVCPSGMDCLEDAGSPSCVDPCQNHTVLDDDWRSTNNTAQDPLYCDDSFTGQEWYRLLLNKANAHIPEYCVDDYRCGTRAPMFLTTPHPTAPGDIVEATVCSHWLGNCCYFGNIRIHVKLCYGGYYVYKLVRPPLCRLAYCTELMPPIPPFPTTTTPGPSTITPTTHSTTTTPGPSTITPTPGATTTTPGPSTVTPTTDSTTTTPGPSTITPTTDSTTTTPGPSTITPRTDSITTTPGPSTITPTTDSTTTTPGPSTITPRTDSITTTPGPSTITPRTDSTTTTPDPSTITPRTDSTTTTPGPSTITPTPGATTTTPGLSTTTPTTDPTTTPAPPQDFHLICGPDKIQVGVNVAEMNSFKLNPWSGNLAVYYCSNHTERDGIVWYEVETVHGACGNILKTNNTHVIFSNSLYIYPSSSSSFNIPVDFSFSCAYPLDTDASLNVALKPFLDLDGSISDSGAKARAFMYLYQDSSYTQTYPAGTVTLPVGSALYVGVTVEDREPRFAAVLEDCYATYTTNPEDPVAYNLIQNQCPDDPRLVSVTQSGSSLQARFTALFPLFKNEHREIYLHCSLSLCDQTSSSCAPSCIHRVRRSISSTELLEPVTIGPITWDKTPE